MVLAKRLIIIVFQISWNGLEAASNEKHNRLREAYQALLFFRQCDDIETWLDEIETQLSSEDHGKDISTVMSVLKKHQLLEQDIANNQKVHELVSTTQTYAEQGHFLADDMTSRIKHLAER